MCTLKRWRDLDTHHILLPNFHMTSTHWPILLKDGIDPNVRWSLRGQRVKIIIVMVTAMAMAMAMAMVIIAMLIPSFPNPFSYIFEKNLYFSVTCARKRMCVRVCVCACVLRWSNPVCCYKIIGEESVLLFHSWIIHDNLMRAATSNRKRLMYPNQFTMR